MPEGRDVGAEIFDVVDGEGRVTGRARRDECHRDPSLMHRAVHVVVRDRRGRVFLQKRAADKDIQPGKWDTSVGGHLLPGEGYDEAALREMREELGIGGEPRLLYRYVWRSDRETELVQTYLLVTDETPRTDPVEIEEGRFFEVREIRDLLGTGACTPNFEEEFRRFSPLLGEAPPAG